MNRRSKVIGYAVRSDPTWAPPFGYEWVELLEPSHLPKDLENIPRSVYTGRWIAFMSTKVEVGTFGTSDPQQLHPDPQITKDKFDMIYSLYSEEK